MLNKLGFYLQGAIKEKLFKNAGILLSGTFLTSVIGFITFTLTARILGPSDFGEFALITSYLAIVERFVSFQPWQAVVRFGSEAIEARDPERLRRIINQCLLFDVVSGVAGVAAGASLAYILRGNFVWLGKHTFWVALFSITIFFHFKGFTTGILRLFHAFKTQATVGVIAAIVKLCAVIVIFFLFDFRLHLMILVWAVTDILSSLIVLLIVWRMYRLSPYFVNKIKFGKGDFPVIEERKKINSFTFYSYISGVIRGLREFDIQIIGVLLGTQAVGLFKVARQFAAILIMVVDTSFQAIYPELARLNAKMNYNAMIKIMVKASIVLGLTTMSILIGFMILGMPFIKLMLGKMYDGVYPIALITMASAVAWAFFHPIYPFFMARGYMKSFTFINAGCNGVYILLLLVITPKFGLFGAGFALILLQVYFGLTMLGYGRFRKLI